MQARPSPAARTGPIEPPACEPAIGLLASDREEMGLGIVGVM